MSDWLEHPLTYPNICVHTLFLHLQKTMFKIYDVPDDNQPNKKKLTTETSKLNSSVNGESSIKNQPT